MSWVGSLLSFLGEGMWVSPMPTLSARWSGWGGWRPDGIYALKEKLSEGLVPGEG